MELKAPQKKVLYTVLFIVTLILLAGLATIIATYAARGNQFPVPVVRTDAVSVSYKRNTYVLEEKGVAAKAFINQQGRVGNSQFLLALTKASAGPVAASLGSILPTEILTTNTIDNLNSNRIRFNQAILGRVAIKTEETLPDTIASKFSYLDPLIQRNLGILNGLEQAKFAWTSVNYFAKLIGDASITRGPTLGIVNLFGNDIYIASELPSGTKSPESKSCQRSVLTTETIFGKEYNLYTNSLTCFGLYDIFVRLVARLISLKTASNIDNPCDPVGFVRTIRTEQVYTEKCVIGPEAESLFDKIYPKGSLDEYTLTGTGNYAGCVQEVQALFQDSKFAKCKPDFPKVQGEVNVYGVYDSFVDAEDLIDKRIVPSSFRTDLQSQCAKLGQNNNLLESSLCLDGVYLDEMFKFFGFDDAAFENIRFQEKVVEFDLSYIMGDGRVRESIDESATEGAYYFPLGAFIPIIIIVIIALLICIITIIVVCVKCRSDGVIGSSTYKA